MDVKSDTLKLASAAINQLSAPGYGLWDTVEICFPNGIEPDNHHDEVIGYLSYYMATIVRWIRSGEYDDRLNTFLIPKAIQFGERGKKGEFPEEEVYMQSHEYLQTWDGNNGDLEELFALVNLYTLDELMALGI